MSNSLIITDDDSEVTLTTSSHDCVGRELRAIVSGKNADIALKLLCYMRDHQLARPFEAYLYNLTGMSVEDFMNRRGADQRVREKILQGDELVRARYVMQLLFRYFEFGMEALMERDLHIMCTVALGGGDEHNFRFGAEQLRTLIRSSPRLSEMLGLPRMLECAQSSTSQEDTSKYFAFLHVPWYSRLFRFFSGG